MDKKVMDKKVSEKDIVKDDQNKDHTIDSSIKNGELGGRRGPEPTRFGDWEINGKCVDF